MARQINQPLEVGAIPSWILQYLDRSDQSPRNLELLKNAFNLLGENDIDTEEKVRLHLYYHVYALDEIINTVIAPNVLSSDLAKQYAAILSSTYNDKNSVLDSLRFAFQKIFQRVRSGGILRLNDMARRCIRITKKSGGNCEVIENNFGQLSWSKRHWSTLICELLFNLAKQLETSSQVYYEEHGHQTDCGGENVVLVEGQYYYQHPFLQWWSNVEGVDYFGRDKRVEILIADTTKRLIDDCRYDLVAGWHLLIEIMSRVGNKKKQSIDELKVSALE